MDGSDEVQGVGIAAAVIPPPFVAAIDIDVPLQNDAAAAMARTRATANAKHGKGVWRGRRTWRIGGASSSGWQASAMQPRGGECGGGACVGGRGGGGEGEAGRGRGVGKGEANVVEARGDPGIILPLSCWWWWGGWEGIKTRRGTVQLVPNVSCTTHTERRPLQAEALRSAAGAAGTKEEG